MYKVAAVILIALMVLVAVGLMIATNKQNLATDSINDIEKMKEVVEETPTLTTTNTPTPTTEPEDTPQVDFEAVENTTQGSQVCKINSECDLVTEYCSKASCTDEVGFCQKRPTSCPQVLSPVCSCEGKTYSSSCSAKESGANIARSGTCSS